MKRIICIAFLALFLISLASAEIIINNQPEKLYNLGDKVNLPVKITSLKDIEGMFALNLICNGIDTKVFQEYLFLSAGDEIKRNPSIPLIKNFIGNNIGTCKIKATFGDEIQLTNEFEVSNSIKITLKNETKSSLPGKDILLKIEATKLNGKVVEGFIDVTVGNNKSKIVDVHDTVHNGFVQINFSMPKETKADQYLVAIHVYEKDSKGEIINEGFVNYNLKILQVPTSLEIIIANSSVEPGKDAKIRTILHDQAGEPISATSTIIIKNSKGEIIKTTKEKTGDYFNFRIPKTQPPKNFSIEASSEGLKSDSSFSVMSKKMITTKIINRTLIITNIGNVLYNDTIVVKIGNLSSDLNITLGVNESKKYLLYAPDGKYKIETLDKEGRNIATANVLLTGKAIEVKEPGDMVSIIKHPFSWVFIIFILVVVGIIIFRKIRKKSFFAYIASKRKKKIRTPKKENSFVSITNKAETSLSISGEKQSSDIICLKIKNIEEIKQSVQAKEAIQKIISDAEENKTYIYENNEYFFFILAPVITKTFRNEEYAAKLAKKIEEELRNHNRIYRQKINFGLAISYGDIIAKKDGAVLKFMGMGQLISSIKRLSSLSEGQIVISENLKNRLPSNIKVKKQEKDNIVYYIITEVKSREEHKQFIRSFLERLEHKD